MKTHVLKEYVNPEMRETLGFPFQNGRLVKPGNL